MFDDLDINGLPYEDPRSQEPFIDLPLDDHRPNLQGYSEETYDFSLVHMRSVFEWACEGGFTPSGFFKSAAVIKSEPFYAGKRHMTVWHMEASYDEQTKCISVSLVLDKARAPVVVKQVCSWVILKRISFEYHLKSPADSQEIKVKNSIALFSAESELFGEIGSVIRCVFTLCEDNIGRYLPDAAALLSLSSGFKDFGSVPDNCEFAVFATDASTVHLPKTLLASRARQVKDHYATLGMITLPLNGDATKEFIYYLCTGQLHPEETLEMYRGETMELREGRIRACLESLKACAEKWSITDLTAACDLYLSDL